MPSIKNVGGKVQVEVDRLDGGLNTKDAPNRIDINQSPDCLNVAFDSQGAVETRSGTTYVLSSIGSHNVDGQATYKDNHYFWADGGMYRRSGTTGVLITSTSGKFATGANVAKETYQQILFCSDGTNGPYRYEEGESFYDMGIGIPSAPTSASDTAGDIAADTYHYKVAFINSHVVTGEAGSATTGVTVAASSYIKVSDIPLATGLNGVTSRKIYRSTSISGTYGLIKTISDNTTTSFTDTVGVGSEGAIPVADGTSPTPFTTIRQFKERLFLDDSSDRSLLRFTDYQNPFVSDAANLFSVHKGTGEVITAIEEQDDLVSVFYDKQSIWTYALTDPSDETTWTRAKSPANIGIVGPNALVKVPEGIVFVGKRNSKLTGIHLLSGIQVAELADDKLRTRNLAGKIEPTIFLWPSSLWKDIDVEIHQNRLYFSVPKNASSTIIDGILYFDINRLGDEFPGSWAPWDGIKVQNLIVHGGKLYGGTSNGDGRIIQFNSGVYQDADGSAIDSYWWSKQIGGESSVESWIKDGRYTNIWYDLLGAWNMNYRFRKDGDSGEGTPIEVDLTPPSGVWDTNVVWDTSSTWGGGASDTETRHNIGSIRGRRFQHRFDNQNTAGQRFKVNSFKSLFNLRRNK